MWHYVISVVGTVLPWNEVYRGGPHVKDNIHHTQAPFTGIPSTDVCVHGTWIPEKSMCECDANWYNDVNQDAISGLFVWCNTSSPPNPTGSPNNGTFNPSPGGLITIGVIVILLIGVIVMVTLCCCCCCRRRRGRGSNQSHESNRRPTYNYPTEIPHGSYAHPGREVMVPVPVQYRHAVSVIPPQAQTFLTHFPTYPNSNILPLMPTTHLSTIPNARTTLVGNVPRIVQGPQQPYPYVHTQPIIQYGPAAAAAKNGEAAGGVAANVPSTERHGGSPTANHNTSNARVRNTHEPIANKKDNGQRNG